ncbi:hypothetical protein ACP4OV_007838 [Aristida adscensionis]
MARTRRGGGAGGDCGGGAKVTPAFDQESTRVLNLSVLRRLDSAVTDILITAAHVAAYSFDEDLMQWSRKPVEGSLFVVKRNTQPRFQLVVMNRLNIENLVEDLLTNFEHQVEVPYVMYRNAADEIVGIWFYNPQECKEVSHLLNRIKHAFSKASPKSSHSSRSALEELEEAPSPSAVPSPAAKDALEHPTSPTMVPRDTKYEFMAAFSKAASCVDDTIGGTGAVQQNQSFGMAAPCHESHSAVSLQPSSALHDQFLSRLSSVPVRSYDAPIPHCTSTIQPTSLIKPAFLAPIASTPTTTADAASSLFIVPPLHPSLAIHQPQSAPISTPFPRPTGPPYPPPVHPSLAIHQPQSSQIPPPFPQPTGPPYPPYGMPLLQPFPPPNPSPLLTPVASYGPVPTRDQVRDALLRLVQNDNFIDMVYREIVKR